MPDKWRDVLGYEGVYQITCDGDMRSLDRMCPRTYRGPVRNKGKKLNPVITKDGYFRMGLYRNGRIKMWLVHRLVWMSFVGVIPDGLEVNHKDGNPKNNTLSNLEVVTKLENIRHAMKAGLLRPARGERQGSAILTERQVRDIRKLSKTGKSYDELALTFGVHSSNIRLIVKGRTWRHIL